MSRVGLISETGSTRYLVIGYLRKDIVRIHNIRNYYSIILMDIRRVKPDKDCYTLAVPLSILPGLNADFDGDILNIIGIMDPSIKHMFRKFNPIKYMITSRDSGLLNDYFAVTKGQKIDLFNFCHM